MKRIIVPLVCLIIGSGAGWYFGYTRPAAQNQRELLAQYHYVRDTFDMTDAEMAEAGQNIPQYVEDAKRQDEMAAVVALGAFKYLERGDIDESKKRLLRPIGSYYRVYNGKGGDTNIIAQIEKAAQDYPAVAAEISRKIE